VNRPIPKLGSVRNPSEFSDSFIKDYSHIALPLTSRNIEEKSQDKAELLVDLSARLLTSLERTLGISIQEEIRKNGPSVTGKAGEVIDIPVIRGKEEVTRVLLVGVGSRSDSDIRKAGTSIGRKVRGNKSNVVSFLSRNSQEAQIHSLRVA